MLFELILLIILGLIIFGFSKIDCHIYLWILDRFFTKPSYTNHLRGQVVWITGASSGIGEYMAYEFAKAGCRIVLSGTNQGRLDAVKMNCLQRNPALSPTDIMILSFDIADFSSHKMNVQLVLAQFKQIDILINNAGRSQRAAFEKIDINVDEDMFRVNVFGPVSLTRAVLNHWISVNYQGQVVVTSSVAGISPAPFSCTYSGSKYALHGYFETLRVENFKNVKVTMLCPGPVFSRILESSFTDQPGVVVNKSHAPDAKRMSTDRCARLCFVAIVHRVSEAWISIQPVLTVCYLSRYCSQIVTLIYTKFISEERLMQIREGK